MNLNDFIMANETLIRPGFYFGIFVIRWKTTKPIAIVGFSLPWWDRLFGTCRDQSRAGHEGMTIGIHTYRTTKQVSWLPGMLALPFVGKVTGYAINRREWSDSHE
jgi:hypothetical protein